MPLRPEGAAAQSIMITAAQPQYETDPRLGRVRFRGRGRISCALGVADVAFVIARVPAGNWLIPVRPIPGTGAASLPIWVASSEAGDATISLAGQADDGWRIDAPGLYRAKCRITGDGVVAAAFGLLEPVEARRETAGEADRVAYRICNFFDRVLTTEIDGVLWTIRDLDSDAKDEARLMPLPTEAATLVAEGFRSLQAAEDAYDSIRWLLSFASCNKVCHFECWEENDAGVSSVRMEPSVSLAAQVFYDLFRPATHQAFLTACWPTWESLPQSEADALKRAIDIHLHAHQSIPMEAQLMLEMVCLEVLVGHFGRGQSDTPQLQDLRSRLARVFDEWRKDTGFDDPDGKLKTKVLFSTEWLSFREGLAQLLCKYDIDIGKLFADPGLVKDFRDKLLHCGRVPDEWTLESVIEDRIIQRLMTLIDLVVLRILGYDGPYLVKALDGFPERSVSDFGISS